MRAYDDAAHRGYSDKYDEYEEGGLEHGGEDEEYEEDPQPTQEELEYLELRQRLKEAARKKIKKEAAAVLGNSQEKKKVPQDNYGSFFGPSKPVIAKRVIEERRSIIETQHLLASKNANSQPGLKKNHASTSNVTKNSGNRPPKVVNQVKMRAQTLKDNRDYSFLLSDDAEPPAPVKEPAPRNFSVPRADARPPQVPQKNKLHMSKPSVSRPPMNKPPVSKPPMSRTPMSKPPARPSSNGHLERNGVSKNQLLHCKEGQLTKAGVVNRLERPSVDQRKMHGGHASKGPGWPSVIKSNVQKVVPPAPSKNVNPGSSKLSALVRPKPPLPKTLSSMQKQSLEQKREVQVSEKPKAGLKRPMPHMKQMRPSPKQVATHLMQDTRPKKRPLNRDLDDDDGAEAIKMIRRMFGYNPSRFRDDDDTSDMEANFDDIQREERQSAKIAREEDERELRLIEEEERREEMRRAAKKRKLAQHR
ncbi:uncharacterized protein [Aristolochia californica]|uniref:uncharacterized protein n=1 Tax=Aristolochia californica TaxID=171875 RepID=UPI0035DA11CD